MVFADLRKDYSLAGLSEDDLDPNPFGQFQRWFDEAQRAKGAEPNAMILATASGDGEPAARTVLLKGLDHGFIFYSNYESAKGRDLEANPRAELLFYWGDVERQVRIHGKVERVDRETTSRYFYSRPRGSQIGASISPQSQVIESREALEARYAELDSANDEVLLPENWGGYRVVPQSIEFWQGRRSRLHDRLRYVRQDDDSWTVERLAP